MATGRVVRSQDPGTAVVFDFDADVVTAGVDCGSDGEGAAGKARLYEIAVAVELGDAGRALRAAATVDTTGLSAERQSRMLVDVARAHAQRRQIGAAVAALIQAEDITPELIRGHDLARQTVSDLLTMQDLPSRELRGLAERLTVR